MRRIRYQVACSLDGYIAGPKDEIDWIVMDPEIDFGAIMAQFDTLLMGRRTYETLPGGAGGFGRMRILVFSRTLRPEEHPGVTIVSDDIVPTLERVGAEPGRDIWLFGGGALFRTLYALDQVDTIEPAVVPVVLGGGLPMLPTPADRKRLQLTNHRVYASSGIVLLEYAVERGAEGD